MASERGMAAQIKTGARQVEQNVSHMMDLAMSAGHSTRAAWGAMGATAYGGAFRAGVAETFGFIYDGPNHSNFRGFLGWKDTPMAGVLKDTTGGLNKVARIRRAAMKHRAGPDAGFFKRQAVGAQYAKRSVVQQLGAARSAMARSGTTTGQVLKKTAGHMAGKALFPAFTAVSMFAAYQQGGVLAAAKTGAMDAAIWGGMKMAGAIIGSGAATLGMAAVAGGYGYYQLGESAKEYRKGLRNLEMGAPVKDPYGTAATLRSRSLQALNSSAVNGRMAMGNEALLMHDSAYSPAFGR